MNSQKKMYNFFMYGLLFVCFFTSRRDWNHTNPAGEIFRFDLIKIGGFINIYYLFVFFFLCILFWEKFVRKDDSSLLGDRNYLKTIFFIFVVPVNLLNYLTIHLYDIQIMGTGLKPFFTLVTYFIATLYIQDIFFKGKNYVQVLKALTVVEIMIFIRCLYSIGKNMLGLGHYVGTLGYVRMGQENDFADFFILMLIIALSRLFFVHGESRWLRVLHVVAAVAATYISVMSARRYVWGELLIAWGLIIFFYYRVNRTGVNRKIIGTCLIVVLMLSAVLIIGPDRLTENYYIGRFMTILSLIDTRFESDLGTENLHRSEIKEGWDNVKKYWLLGVTPMGGQLLEREETKYQAFTFVHNGYISIWLTHGLLGIILFFALYLLSIKLAHFIFFQLKDFTGLILLTFMICQMVKNIVWPTVIEHMNITIIYIFLISLVLKTKQLLVSENINQIHNKTSLNPI